MASTDILASVAPSISEERPPDSPVSGWKRFSWTRTIIMHLFPAALTFAVACALAPLLLARHIPPTFGLTIAFACILTPLELGLVLYAAHKATGRWSLKALPSVIAYRQPLRRWWFLIPALFVVALALAILWTPAGNAIGSWFTSHLPYWCLPSYDNTVGFSKMAVVVTMLITLLIDGIINPTVEEIYFRGYLLPRLPVAGWRVVPVGALLFAVQHYWQPFNWVLIFTLELILIALVRKSRSIRLGIVMHVLANSFGALIALVGVLAK